MQTPASPRAIHHALESTGYTSPDLAGRAGGLEVMRTLGDRGQKILRSWDFAAPALERPAPLPEFTDVSYRVPDCFEFLENDIDAAEGYKRCALCSRPLMENPGGEVEVESGFDPHGGGSPHAVDFTVEVDTYNWGEIRHAITYDGDTFCLDCVRGMRADRAFDNYGPSPTPGIVLGGAAR